MKNILQHKAKSANKADNQQKHKVQAKYSKNAEARRSVYIYFLWYLYTLKKIELAW